MGCHQSKVEEQVVAPASGDLIVHSTIEASVTAEVPVTAPEAEATPATEVAAETVAEEEANATTTEETAQEEATPAAEPVVESSEVAEVAVEAAPASVNESTEAVASDVAPTETEEAAPAEAETSETPAEEPVTEEVPVIQADQPQQEPSSEDVDTEPTVSFKSVGVSFGERNVVFYEFSLVDKSDPAKDVTIRKRFNDFKAIHAEVAKLMASEANVPASQKGKFATYPALPALPKAGASSVLFGRRNPNLTGDRKAQFEKILNAIARHPIAYGSPAFQAFLRKA